MLQNRRKNRIARMVIGSMRDLNSSNYMDTEHKSDYDDEEMGPPEKKEMGSYESLEMACGSMLAAIRNDDVALLCRSFKAAFRACEMGEDY